MLIEKVPVQDGTPGYFKITYSPAEYDAVDFVSEALMEKGAGVACKVEKEK